MTSGDQCCLSNIRKINNIVDLSNCFVINVNITSPTVNCSLIIAHKMKATS